jgi:hypothetical protein
MHVMTFVHNLLKPVMPSGDRPPPIGQFLAAGFLNLARLLAGEDKKGGFSTAPFLWFRPDCMAVQMHIYSAPQIIGDFGRPATRHFVRANFF